MLKTLLAPLVIAASLLSSFAVNSAADAQVVNVRTKRICTGLNFPVFVTHAPGDTSRLFILQKTGAIRIFDLTTNTLLPTAFLTVTTSATAAGGDERGLLGLAFDPGYAKNGQFYIYYTNSTPSNVVSRYTVSSANPNVANATGTIILQWSDPFTNHNGGWMGFGPDGNLYIGTGDGGSANDPSNRAQTITAMRLGKILRIKPNIGGVSPYYTSPSTNPFFGATTGDDEIWSYGMRNPWRCSFDRQTGDFWIGDVGQNAVEEVNVQAAAAVGGRNYGWRCTEGTSCTGLTGCTCNGATLTAPVHVYNHAAGTGGGFCLTGGYVYRGCLIDNLSGTYFFADYSSNNVWSFRYNVATGVKSEFTLRNTQFTPSLDGFALNEIASFGEDANGEVYVVDQGSANGAGAIFKIVPTTGDAVCAPPCVAADIDCDGDVDATDLATLLGNWGGTGAGDIDGNGTVDAADLAGLLGAWS